MIAGQFLQSFHTFKTNQRAQKIALFSSAKELIRLLDLPYQSKLLLGGGSNVLFKEDYPGLVMVNVMKGKKVIKETEDEILIEVQSGENWHEFVLWCLQKNLGGIENLSLIPGTIGAAPMQNIGAYGVELEEVFHSLKALELETKVVHEFDHRDCEFGYRTSVFKTSLVNQYCILSVTLRLTKLNHKLRYDYGALQHVLKESKVNDEPTIQEISKAVIAIRNEKLPDPEKIGNAGSFFKNPVIENSTFNRLYARYPLMPVYPTNRSNWKKIPAAWLIEQCGWKGKSIGRAQCSEKHALILTNLGGASGKEIFHLAQEIIADVRRTFGITLEPEVNII